MVNLKINWVKVHRSRAYYGTSCGLIFFTRIFGIFSGNLLHSYWKWPSRNSELSHFHSILWIFPSFFVNVYQAGYSFHHPMVAVSVAVPCCAMLCQVTRNLMQELLCFCPAPRGWKYSEFTIDNLVGGLEHEFYFSHHIGNDNPNWHSYFSEGFKPPTSNVNPRWLNPKRPFHWGRVPFKYWIVLDSIG